MIRAKRAFRQVPNANKNMHVCSILACTLRLRHLLLVLILLPQYCLHCFLVFLLCVVPITVTGQHSEAWQSLTIRADEFNKVETLTRSEDTYTKSQVHAIDIACSPIIALRTIVGRQATARTQTLRNISQG